MHADVLGSMVTFCNRGITILCELRVCNEKMPVWLTRTSNLHSRCRVLDSEQIL